MNLKEGTRRLALLLGVLGAILGGFHAYPEWQAALSQSALHNKFAQLATSDVVQRERKALPAKADADALAKNNGAAAESSDASGFHLRVSEVGKDGIKTISWLAPETIYSIETADGQNFYPTPAPPAQSYIRPALFLVLGFFVPWAIVRALGWVAAGLFQPSK